MAAGGTAVVKVGAKIAAKVAAKRAAKATASAVTKAGAKRVVIGENMHRVKAAAKEIGAETFSGRTLKENAAWIQNKINDGYQIIDIGPDFVRRRNLIAIGKQPASQYYNLERRMTKGYGNYYKAFSRFGKLWGTW